MPLNFVNSQRSEKGKLIDGGYLFVKDRTYANHVTWQCDKRKKHRCKARLTTSNDEIVSRAGEHFHGPSAAKCGAAEVTDRIRNRAVNTLDSTRTIISQETQNLAPGVAAAMPSEQSLRRTIQRQRAGALNAPANPPDLRSFVVPPEYSVTNGGEQFLSFDSGPGDDRVIVFCSTAGLETLIENKNWLCDGTFKVSPTVFFQVYTIHALVEDQVIPCAFALLPDKQKGTYKRVLRALKDLPRGHLLNPDWVETDFEQAAIQAVSEEFPNSEVSGCLFHLGQSCWRKLQEMGHSARYSEDVQFSTLCKMLPALAYVPVADLADAFEEVCAELPPELDNYIEYFERTYMGRTVGGRRREPIFGRQMWNQYQNTISGLPRTNNAVEGWHRGFQSSVACDHPTIWKLIQCLKDEEGLVAFRFNQQMAGHPRPVAKKRKYEDNDLRIVRRVAHYNTVNTVTYVRGIAHNVRF